MNKFLLFLLIIWCISIDPFWPSSVFAQKVVHFESAGDFIEVAQSPSLDPTV